MDAELRKELSDMEQRLTASFTSGIKALQDNLTTIFNKDIDYIKVDMSRHDKYHTEHFADIKELERKVTDNKEMFELKITDSRESILKTVDDRFKEHNEQTNTSKNIWIQVIVAAAAVGAMVISLIGLGA